MIKIMHVCSDTNVGGAGRYLMNLLSELNPKDFQLILVLPKGSLLKPYIEEKNIEVIESDIEGDKSFQLNQVFKLRNLIKEVKPHIVHTHGSLSARIAAKLSGVRGVVYTRHYVEGFELPPETWIKKKIKSLVNNFLCDGVIGVAKECLPVLQRMGLQEDKIYIIPNGVTKLSILSEEEKKRIRENYHFQEGTKIVTILARLSEEKGHDIFIKTMEQVFKETENVIGVIAGTGPKEAEIKEQIKALGLTNKIIMTGFLENVEQLLNITDIQMNTSYTEAQSLALSEGLSIGIPAIVTHTGGNPSMIRQGINGFVAPVGDYKALARDVVRLLGDQETYRKMQQSCYIIYEENYTSAVMARKTEEFYKAVLEKKGYDYKTGGEKNEKEI